MAATRLNLASDGPITVNGLTTRSEELSLINQGPVTRVTVWNDLLENHNLNGQVMAHYFRDSGLLLLDLEYNNRTTQVISNSHE